MVQEFLLEVIQDVSFFERVKTKYGTVRKFRYREDSRFFKLRKKTLKGIQGEIDSVISDYQGSIIDWKVYTSFPFE